MSRSTPDMPPDEVRREAEKVLDWMVGYLADIDRYPVLSQVRPGEIADRLSDTPPRTAEGLDRLLADFEEVIVPGITHWNHPSFFAYFPSSSSGPAILGEMLAATLNVNAMLWRSSPAATELEERTLDWMRQMVGLPEVFRGHIQDTASTSTMVALACAREMAAPNVREEGLAGAGRLRIYCSEDGHSSIDKAAITLGLGLGSVRRIGTDDQMRMQPAALAAAIEEDLANGIRPMAVVATAGTTSTTAIDPIPEIGEICGRFGVWMHVDAAYGGAAAIVPELRGAFAGWERADSIVINPHKWMFVPLDCSVLFLRDPQIARRAFAVLPEYLRTPEADGVPNLMEYGPALGRRFRALKLWMTIRYFGVDGMAERIAEHVRLARLFGGWVDDAPDWERLAPIPLGTACFRFVGHGGSSDEELDRINAEILERVNASGEAFLSHTRIRGRFAIRLAVGNVRSTEHHVAAAWSALRSAAAAVQSPTGPTAGGR